MSVRQYYILKPLTFPTKCCTVLLEEKKVDVSGQIDLSSMQCDICYTWFQDKCGRIKYSAATLSEYAANV